MQGKEYNRERKKEIELLAWMHEKVSGQTVESEKEQMCAGRER